MNWLLASNKNVYGCLARLFIFLSSAIESRTFSGFFVGLGLASCVSREQVIKYWRRGLVLSWSAFICDKKEAHQEEKYKEQRLLLRPQKSEDGQVANDGVTRNYSLRGLIED